MKAPSDSDLRTLLMKVNEHSSSGSSIPLQNGRADQTNGVSPSTRSGSASKVTGGRSDQVEISGLIGQISQGLEAGEGSRAEHVNRIAAAVQSGSYQVDSRELSRSIVNDALQAWGGR
jgi:flagellar biosynthesis anti-sigma factor FlgM